MLSTSAIKCRSDLRIFQFVSAIRRPKKKKNCQRLPKTDTFVHYVGNGFSILRYFAKDYYRLIFKKFVLPKLYCLHITGEMEPNISLVDHLVLVSFFVCRYYSRRKHYPTLEKTLCSEYSSV